MPDLGCDSLSCIADHAMFCNGAAIVDEQPKLDAFRNHGGILLMHGTFDMAIHRQHRGVLLKSSEPLWSRVVLFRALLYGAGFGHGDGVFRVLWIR